MDNNRPCTSSKSDKAIKDYERRKRIREFFNKNISDLKDLFSQSNTLFFFFSGFFFISIPLFTAWIGFKNLNNCQINDQLPIWILFNSFILCLFGLFLTIKRYFKIDRINQISLILTVWAVFGLIIVLPLNDSVNSKKTHNNQLTCSKTLYFSSVAVSILELIICFFSSFNVYKIFRIASVKFSKKENLKIYNGNV